MDMEQTDRSNGGKKRAKKLIREEDGKTNLDRTKAKDKHKNQIVTEKKKQKRRRQDIKKNIVRIGTWNVNTLLRPGKVQEVAIELKRYKVDIAGLQEIRWSGEGKIDKGEYEIWYAGEKKQGYGGTAFLVQDKLKKKILQFKAINGRLSYIRVKFEPNNLSVINVYAPTEQANEEIKQEFYNELEKLYDEVPKRDTLIILGDFNAQVGRETCYREIANIHTIHEVTNENGEMLCNFATATNMFIMSTKFRHKKNHKITWMQPGTTDGNQIDHMLVKERSSNWINDVRSYRGTSLDTDHHLVIAKCKLKKNKIKQEKPQRKWNIEKLENEESRMQYNNEIEKGLRSWQPVNTVEDEWRRIKESVVKAAECTIGYKENRRKKHWFDEECEHKLEQKKLTRLQWIKTNLQVDLDIYKEKRREVNKLCKKKKKEWIENTLEEIEREARSNNTRPLYRHLKQNKKSRTTKIMEEEQWIKFFRDLYKDDPITDGQQEEQIEHEIENLEQIPTYEEVEETINKLKNNKATGTDQINAELIKEGGKDLHKTIHKLLVKIWNEEKMPEDWKMGMIMPIPKKGDLTKCTNYRGITLLNITYKILTSLLKERVTQHTETVIGNYQFGFRKGKSTSDALHIMKQITEKCYEYDIDIHILFIDFKQAFDQLIRTKIIQDLERIRTPQKLIKLVKMTMEKSKAIVLVGQNKTDSFEVNRGVRQGDALSALLFITSLDDIIRKVKNSGTINVKAVQIIAYADDVAIVARTRKELEETFTIIEEGAKEKGLTMNENKTKYMHCSRRKKVMYTGLRIMHYNFEEVQMYKYLGITIHRRDERINNKERIQTGYRAFYANKQLLRDKNLSKNTKLRVYKTIIRPIVTYAAEMANLTQKEEEQLKIFERKIIRIIMGPKKIGEDESRQLMNFEIDALLNGENIVRIIKAQRIRWYGHIHRMDSKDPVKIITGWNPTEGRPRGRPKARWKDQTENDIRLMRISDWKSLIKDRKGWRKIVEKAKSHQDL